MHPDRRAFFCATLRDDPRNGGTGNDREAAPTGRLLLLCLPGWRLRFGSGGAERRLVRLWPDGAPGAQARAASRSDGEYWVRNVHDPSLTAFPADPRHANAPR